MPDHSFLSSTTNQLLLFAGAVIIILFFAAVAVLITTGENPFTLVGAAYTSITSLVGGAIYKNVKQDVPIRQQEAALAIAQQAAADPSIPNENIPMILAAGGNMPSQLQTWVPEEK